MSSMLYLPDGRTRVVRPANGAYWTLDELQAFVGGYIEIVRTIDGEFMVINEHGKIQEPPLEANFPATRIYQHGRKDYIAGPAVVVDNLCNDSAS